MSNLCENCKVRPQYVDGTKVHKYCGKTCASNTTFTFKSLSSALQAVGSTISTSSSQSSASLCSVCNLKQRYVDGSTGKVHPYCGKTCASKAHPPIGASTSGSQTSGLACAIPGCNRAVYKDPKGIPSKFCSITHRSLAASEACLMCRKVVRKPNNFCGKQCTDNARALSPAILEVPEVHVVFESVKSQFKSSWRHKTKCPDVKHVFKIIGTKTSVDQYEAYRDAVEARGNFVQQKRSAGNENRRWHGTKRECELGEKGRTQFCGSTSCSLCNIITTSFDLSFFGKKTNWGRFGSGIYTSSTSSKANDYSVNVKSSKLKAVLLNKVIVGKGAKLKNDDSSLTCPPPGHDSVLGETGGSLNYDELIVYTNDAIRPSYLVMYS